MRRTRDSPKVDDFPLVRVLNAEASLLIKTRIKFK
jgi:hypothetical protein